MFGGGGNGARQTRSKTAQAAGGIKSIVNVIKTNVTPKAKSKTIITSTQKFTVPPPLPPPKSVLVRNNRPMKLLTVPDQFAPVENSTATKSVAKKKCDAVPIRMSGLFSPIENATPHHQRPAAESLATEVSPLPSVNKRASSTKDTLREIATTLTPKATADAPANYVSPRVTTSRGKSSGRKSRAFATELQQSFCIRNEAVKYFRHQVDNETERLMSLTAKWDKYKREHGDIIDSAYVDLIDVTIGQTRLLVTKKFNQFRELIERCASAGDGEQIVLPSDLDGFWTMVYMQVDNCDARFVKLDSLMAQNWCEDVVAAVEDAAAAAAAPPAVKVRKPKASTVARVGKLSIRSQIKIVQERLRAKKAEMERLGENTPKR